MPQFSIIIPTWNAASKLAATLDTVLAQSGVSLEILVMDGASTDDTIAVMERYRDYPNVHFYREPDAGVYDAMNKGIAKAKGEFIYFLGAGDLLRPDILQQVKTKIPPPSQKLRFVYGQMWVPEGYAYDGPFTASKLRVENIGHQAIFFERGIFELLGGYDLRYPTFSDYVFNFKCWGNPKIQPHYIELVIADYEAGGISALGDANYQADRAGLVRRHLGMRQYGLLKLSQIIPSSLRQKIREVPLRARRHKTWGAS